MLHFEHLTVATFCIKFSFLKNDKNAFFNDKNTKNVKFFAPKSANLNYI